MNRSRSIALACLACSALAMPTAHGQDAHVAVRNSFGVAELTFIEVEAGAVQRSETLDLNAQFAVNLSVRAVEFVGAEIWLATANGLLRYGGSPLTFQGRSLPGELLQQIVPTTNGAFVFNASEAIEVDASGLPLQRTPFVNRKDVIAFQGGFLAIDLVGEIRRYDANFAPLATFGANAQSLAMAQNIFYQPDRLTLLTDGRVAVAAGVSIGIIDANGVAENVFNPSQFEFDVVETANGLLYIPSAIESCLMDPDTGEAFDVQGVLGAQNFLRISKSRRAVPGASSNRGCSTAPNSVGSGARMNILASDGSADRSVTLVTTGLPAGETTLLTFGDTTFNGPFGAGSLCISPLGNIVRSSLGVSSQSGTSSTQMTFLTPGLGASFTAGTSWTFQTIYRDRSPAGAAVFNGSDSVTLRFVP